MAFTSGLELATSLAKDVEFIQNAKGWTGGFVSTVSQRANCDYPD